MALTALPFINALSTSHICLAAVLPGTGVRLLGLGKSRSWQYHFEVWTHSLEGLARCWLARDQHDSRHAVPTVWVLGQEGPDRHTAESSVHAEEQCPGHPDFWGQSWFVLFNHQRNFSTFLVLCSFLCLPTFFTNHCQWFRNLLRHFFQYYLWQIFCYFYCTLL